MFEFVKQFILIGVSQMFPPLNSVVLWMGNTFFAKKQAIHRGFVAEAVAKRLEKKTDRPDLSVSLLLRIVGTQLMNKKYDIHPEQFRYPE